MSKKPPEDVASKLHKYMAYRAEREGTEHTLTPDFYREHINNGVRKVFGVHLDNNNLIKDEQNPNTFRKWTSTQNNVFAFKPKSSK